jgi:uncharacterized protein YggU (UPF0235/DUF167 family)
LAAGRADRQRTGALSALRVRLTPGANTDRIDGSATDADGRIFLKARVRAVPENNEANLALEALIAKAIGVAKSRVRVTRGHTGRLKTLEVDGASEAEVAAFIATQTAKR